jgi:tetratricopeptide (TPR) repeat protein
MTRPSLPAICALAVFACGGKSDEPAARVAPGDPVAAPVATGDACAKAKPHGAFAWIVDDYDAALACARQKKLPIVMDLWAPWCHTCLSMMSTVFHDRSFGPDAGKFVFVELDTDREVNAKAVEKFPPAAWPTFYVIAHEDERVLARWVGAATIDQFHTFLDTGLRMLASGGGEGTADAKLLAAERALQSKKLAEAEQELVAALAAAPPGWPRRPDALVSLITTRAKLKDHAGCMATAEKVLAATGEDELGRTASASDFLVSAAGCAEDKAKAEPERVKKLREQLVARWQKLLDDPGAPLSVDDRSDAMVSVRETLIALDTKESKERARAIAEKQRAMLDEAASAAKDPMAAMTYNWHRAEVYVFLGKPLELVPALEKSAKDLPKEYDPRSRLGWIYLKAGKYDEAIKWTDEALALVYGPRKTRVLTQRAEIAKLAGDKAGERKYLEAIVKHLESLPASQTTPAAIAKAKQTVEALDKPPTAKL